MGWPCACGDPEESGGEGGKQALRGYGESKKKGLDSRRKRGNLSREKKIPGGSLRKRYRDREMSAKL